MAEYRLRRASIEDARSIAEIHAKAWRETYLGVMRAEALASIDLDDWTRRWRERIGSSEGAQAVFIACEGETSGWVRPLQSPVQSKARSAWLRRAKSRRFTCCCAPSAGD